MLTPQRRFLSIPRRFFGADRVAPHVSFLTRGSKCGEADMLWFFDRDHESLRLETRYDGETMEFVALVRYPNGRDLERRFRERREFRDWLEAFERALAGKRWLGRRGPIILPHGWPPDRPAD